MSGLFLISAGGALGALLGVRLGGRPRRASVPAAIGGLLLVLFALCVLLPQALRSSGAVGGLWFAAAFLGTTLFDRKVHAICPACLPVHRHDECAVRLHGYALPLFLAATLHSLADGLTLQTTELHGAGWLPLGGLLLHKVPEGLILGAMFRASVGDVKRAALAAIAAESATLAGGFLASVIPAWAASAQLAVCGGFFLFLGLHALHDLRRFRPRAAGVVESVENLRTNP